jgi:hypothetical protein
MSFDLRKEPLMNLCSLSELFKHRDFFLKAFVCGVHAIEKHGHISKHDGIEANS